jgi:chromosome segregation ATPase
MNYFGPGIREIVRLAQRANWRLGGWRAARGLEKAETQLGLLGWQQADFDEETQRQVDAIQNVEREQGELSNRAAGLAQDIEKLNAERAAVRAEFDQKRSALEAERAKTREPMVELDRLIGVVRSRPADGNRRMAELDREERETDASYKKLLGVQPQSPQVRDEILHQRQRLLAIPNERQDIKAQQVRATADLQEREQQRAAIEQRSAELDRQLRDVKKAADQRDAEFASQLKGVEKEHARAEAEVRQLERAKLDPYREIGRVLADSGVAPVNQPQALERVLQLRQTIATNEMAVAESLERTAAEDREMLRISLGLWAVIAVAAIMVFAAFIKGFL